MSRDEAFKEYEETLAKLSKEYNKGKEEAKVRLNLKLSVLREQAHKELKAIRAISQKTRQVK